MAQSRSGVYVKSNLVIGQLMGGAVLGGEDERATV